jgi:hypothetical protein
LAFSTPAYRYWFWIQKDFQYLLLAILAVNICSQIIGEKVQRWHLTLFAILVASSVGFAHGLGFSLRYLLGLRIAVCLVLGMMLTLAELSRELELIKSKASALITWGLLIFLTAESLAAILQVTFLHQGWAIVARIYPAGRIAALSVWVFAALQGSRSARVITANPLPPKIKPKGERPAAVHKYVM